MPRPDEGLIHAWLDGELEAEEAARVEQLVAEDAEWAAAAAEARGLIAASTRILGALDVVAGDVIPQGRSAAPAFGSSRVPTPAVVPRRAMPTWLKLAASVVLVAGLSYVGLREDRAGTMAAVTLEQEAAPKLAAERVAEPVAPPVAVLSPRPSAASSATGAAANAVLAKANESAPPAPPPARSELSVGDARDAAIASTRGVTGGAGVAGGIASGVAGGVASPAISPPAPTAQSIIAAPEQELRRAANPVERRVRTSASSAPATAQASALADAPSAKLAQEMVVARTLAGCWLAATTARVDSLQRDPVITETRGDTLTLALRPPGATATVVRLGMDEVHGRARDIRGRITEFSARLVKCAP